MTHKSITQADRELYSLIATRSSELRRQRLPHSLMQAMEEFTAQAIGLGWDSANQLHGAITSDGRRKTRVRPSKATFKAYSDTKTIATKAIVNGKTTAIDKYREAICKSEDHFVMDDEKMAPLIGCRVVTVARMRSKLKTEEGFGYQQVEHGYVFTLPILSVPPATNGFEAQLPLPADESVPATPTIDPVATTVTGTLEDAPGVALVVTESDLAVVVKKLARIEALLDSLPSMVALLTDLYVQNGRHHEASSSEQRQLRALVAQLLQKWM